MTCVCRPAPSPSADRIRRDIREDREGTRLRLALRVRDAGSCEPLPDAVVDIWHADAGGAYSGFDGGGGGNGGPGGGGGGGQAQTDSRYPRGAQVTNGDGIVEVTTIYPGWYPGRAVHIHAKVHLDAQTVLTTQLYFDDAVSERVYAARPYSARGRRDQATPPTGSSTRRSSPRRRPTATACAAS